MRPAWHLLFIRQLADRQAPASVEKLIFEKAFKDIVVKNTSISGFPQLILRLALGAGFLLPVMDRIGWLGAPGTGSVAWGDWQHFITYTHTLMPFLSRSVANLAGLFATAAEVVFGILLIIGYRIKLMALGAALLTFLFGISMAIFSGPMAPFSYPVFVFTGAGLVLSRIGYYKWSIDALLRAGKV